MIRSGLFIKSIIKEIQLLKGKIKELRPIKYGYIKQNDFVFEENLTALEFLKKNHPLKTEKELRNILGNFLFSGDDVFKNVLNMSNGEKMRLILSSLSLNEYDILLLDEPTNHLDLMTKDSLIDSLLNFKGCLIFISHDRYFINRLANKVLYISKDITCFIDGDYDDLKKYLERLKSIKPLTMKEIEENLKKEIPIKEKLSNNKINELKKELSEIEQELEDLDEKINDDFTSYTEFDELNEKKDTLEARYLEILELLDLN